MNHSITLLDGAIGTSLWAKAEALGYEKVPVWRYNIEHPELVTELVSEYIAAGSQMVLANTFGANGPAVKRSSNYDPEEVIRCAVRAAKKAAEGTNAKVTLSAGPLSTLMEPYGDTTEEEARDIYEVMIGAGVDEGADCIMLQTFFDVEMMRVAAEVAKQYNKPLFCTMSFEKVGKTIMGNSVKDVIETLEPIGLSGIGLNCSLGPDLALPIIREFHEKTELPLVFKPNAGKPIMAPDGTVSVHYTADIFAKEVAPALEFVSYVGGCCGSDVSYVKALKKLL